MAGLYVHIPFCVKKCRYCDFVSFPEEGRLAEYLIALDREAALTAAALPDAPRITTVFIGGGTPSLLSGPQMERLFSVLRAHFSIAEDAECTAECNPGTLTREKLAAYRAAGLNRLSVGVQSTDAGLLAGVGRIHTPEQARAALRMARESGFENLNADVMHGLPGQTEAQYLQTLRDITALAVSHISAYSLILEAHTPLYEAVARGECTLPDPDETADMQDAGLAFLEGAGYRRYEISNFARDGFACRHNLNYWDNGEYIGLGLAAHSAMRLPARGGAVWTRWSNTESLPEYLRGAARGKRPLAETLRLYPRDEMFESVMLGLRKIEGLDKAAFAARFGLGISEAYPEACRRLAESGWLAETDARFALNDKGLDLQNAALQYFMS